MTREKLRSLKAWHKKAMKKYKRKMLSVKIYKMEQIKHALLMIRNGATLDF